MPKACQQDCSAPAIRSATRRFFLTLASGECQHNKATGRGCRTRQPRGGYPPQEAVRPPREPGRALHGTSRSRGLPSGTRVRRFVSRSGLWLLTPIPACGEHRDSTRANLAAGGLAGITAPQRSDRASWTRSLQTTRPAFQAPIACHVGCWYRRPVAGRRRAQYAGARRRGDKVWRPLFRAW
jgi:hypothetical protein